MITEAVQYNIDRKGASKLLKVSMRTVDRYLKSKSLSSRVVDGRVWLSKDELGGFIERKHRGLKVDSIKVSTDDLSSDKWVDSVDRGVDKVDVIEAASRQSERKSKSTNTYKKLYETLQGELKEKQARLEIANYRVGQLENQLRNSIPLLQYHRETNEKQIQEKKFKDQMGEQNLIIKKARGQLRNERALKKIFAFLCFLLMALQPLWLLLLQD